MSKLLTRFSEQLKTLEIDFLSHVLIGISGGLDSMVLSHLLLKKGISITWAHVNYGLRGQESEGDMEFLLEYAERWDVPLEIKRFDKEQDLLKGESLQMAARRFRYDFFQELWQQKKHFTHLATGHHLDDSIENFFLKLSRGSGIASLAGGVAQFPYLVKPLQVFSKEELKQYAEKEGITWREDSSNAKNDYERNQLRNLVLPAYYSLHPRVKKSLPQSLEHIKYAHSNLTFFYEAWAKDCVIEKTEERAKYELQAILDLPYAEDFLQYLLPDFYDIEWNQVARAIGTMEPKYWQGKAGHLCLKGTQLSYRKELAELATIQFTWSQLPVEIPHFGVLSKEFLAPLKEEYRRKTLIIRPWTHGDSFQPKGFKGSKSISDYLTDRKVSGFDKSEVYVLEIDGKIACVLGFAWDVHHVM